LKNAASVTRLSYASIIGVLFERGYVTKRGTALVPGWTAFAVIALLERFYTDFVEYDFTAELENDLDRITVGELKGTDYSQRWYLERANTLDSSTPVSIGRPRLMPARLTLFLSVTELSSSGKFGPYLEIQTGGAKSVTFRFLTALPPTN